MEKNSNKMETAGKRSHDELDKDVEFSYSIKAGKRIYYMDVRRTRKDDLYLSITESKKIAQSEGDNSAPVFEKHKIFLYKEDFGKFIDGLSKAISYIHENRHDEADSETAANTDVSASEIVPPQESVGDALDNMKIDF